MYACVCAYTCVSMFVCDSARMCVRLCLRKTNKNKSNSTAVAVRVKANLRNIRCLCAFCNGKFQTRKCLILKMNVKVKTTTVAIVPFDVDNQNLQSTNVIITHFYDSSHRF